MAKTSIYDYDTTASANTDIGGIDSTGTTGKVKDGDNYTRSMMSHVRGFANDLGGANTVGGTADAITLGLSAAPTALVDGYRLVFSASGANTGNVTLNVTPSGGSAFGAKKVLQWSGGTAVELPANTIPGANALVEVVYDPTQDSANGAFMLLTAAAVPDATTSVAGKVQLATLSQTLAGTETALAVTPAGVGQFSYALSTAVGSNALTISLKHRSGADPSADNPVTFDFRSATAGTGTPDPLSVAAATSLVISSGSTMGFTSGQIGRLWIVGFNDAGTFRLGAVNCLSGTSIMALRDGIYSSTAEGGSGGADSAQTIYTGTAVTSKAMVVLGYLEATEATAGTWATAPSLVKVISQGDALPGDTVQVRRTETGAVATGSGIIPADDTIPQSTEGDQYMSQAITPASAANVLRVSGAFTYSVTGSHADYISALFQDSGANALAATDSTIYSSDGRGQQSISHMRKAATISSTTFKWRAGPGDAGTTTFNGAGGARRFGGTMNSFMQAEEIVA